VKIIKEYQVNTLAGNLMYCLLLLMSLLTSNVQAATFSVNTDSDAADDDLLDGRCQIAITGDCSLRAAIQQANALGGKDTILLPANRYVLQGTANEDVNRGGDLDITEDLTITGAAADTTVIDGKGLDRIFDIQGANTVNLSHITLVNGNAGATDGGAIRVARASNNNVLPVYVFEDMVINNSNAGRGNGGAVYIGVTSRVEFTRVSMDNNGAQDGGAVYSLSAAMHFRDSLVTNNRATRNGGGVASFGGMHSMATAFTNNLATGSGGGIIANNDLIIDQGEVSNNRALGQLSQSGNGGGIWLASAGNVFLSQLKVHDNQAARSGGGLMLNNRFVTGQIALNDVSLKNNHAQESGGAVEGYNISSITNTRIIDNTSTTRGGGLTLSNTTRFLTTLSASVIAGNQITNTGSSLNRNALGGGLYGSNGHFAFNNMTINSNRVTASSGRSMGGGVFLIGRAGDIASFTNTTMALNSSSDFGANISRRYHTGTTRITNSIVSDAMLSSSCYGTLNSGGFNIDSDNSCGLTTASDKQVDPLLRTTFAGEKATITGLQPQSQAIDNGDNSACPDTDQRLHARSDLQCDIGSLEEKSLPVNAGEIVFSLHTQNVSESDGTVSLFVQRLGGSEGDIAVNYAMTAVNTSSISGHRFTDAITQLVWANGDTAPKNIDITLNNDTVYEADEHLLISLLNPTGGATLGATLSTTSGDQPQTTLIVTNDDPPVTSQIRMESASISINESRPALLVNLVRNSAFPFHAISADIDVSQSTATLGNDYTLTNDVVVFPAGILRQSLVVELIDDPLFEGPEVIALNVVTPSEGAVIPSGLGTMRISINDNESRAAQGIVEFTVPGMDVAENSATAGFSIQRKLGTRGALAVSYAVVGGTATQNTDYVLQSGSAFLDDGINQINIPFTLVDDALLEGTESIEIELTKVEGGGTLGSQRSLTISILDNETPVQQPGTVQFALADNAVAEDAGVLAISVLRTDGLDGAISVDYKILGGTARLMSDYVFAEGTLVFKDQEKQKSLMISITDDTLLEPDESVILSLSKPTGGATIGRLSTHTLTIQDNDSPPAGQVDTVQFERANAAVNESVGFIEVKVVRTPGMKTDATVAVVVTGGSATFGVDYLLFEGTLLFSPGTNVVTVPITVFDDYDVEANETITLTIGSPQGATLGKQRNTVVTINDNDTAF